MTYVLSNGKMIGVYIKEGRKASNAFDIQENKCPLVKTMYCYLFCDCVLPKPAVPKCKPSDSICITSSH